MTTRGKRRIGYASMAVAVVAVGAWAVAPRSAAATGPEITVYKSPTCGCCTAWGEHLEENGFRVEMVETTELARVKAEHGVPPGLGACHTAVVDGYVVEGHVPADVIERFLAEGSDAAGLAVPGMPIGSPGMEVAGRAPESYDVLVFDGEGRSEVYESR